MLKLLYVKDKGYMSAMFNLQNCPFCQTELINSMVYCSSNKKFLFRMCKL